MKKSKCKYCKKEFVKKNQLNPYCSTTCYNKLEREKKKAKEEKIKERKRKKREKKAMSISKLVEKADKLFSLYIRRKYSEDGENVRCITCGNTLPIKEMQNGHFVSRRFYATRWLETNCHPQDYKCNVGMSGEQYKHGQYIDKKYGEGTSDMLMSMTRHVNKITQVELLQIIENISNKLKEL